MYNAVLSMDSDIVNECFFYVLVDCFDLLKSIDGPDLVLSTVDLNDWQLLLTILRQSLA